MIRIVFLPSCSKPCLYVSNTILHYYYFVFFEFPNDGQKRKAKKSKNCKDISVDVPQKNGQMQGIAAPFQHHDQNHSTNQIPSAVGMSTRPRSSCALLTRSSNTLLSTVF